MSDESGFGSSAFVKGTMHMFEKLKRMRLSKDVKSACDKRRMKAIEEIEKRKHHQRQQDAQRRQEETRRRITKRIEEEEDPEKQRKMHADQAKKDERKRQKRLNKGMKQIKVH